MIEEGGAKNRARDERKVRDHQVGLAPRRMAVGLLAQVLQNGRPIEEAYGRFGDRGPDLHMAHRDRAFARAIVATTLRRLGQIEVVLQHFLDRPLPSRRGNVWEILATGACQLLFLGTPAHAAIDLAVRLTQYDRRGRHMSGLVNAVLRRVSKQGPALVRDQNAVLLNTPKWLWESWCAAWGEETARAIAQASLTEAALDLTPKADPELWADRLGGTALVTGSVRLLHRGRVEAIEGYGEGAWWVQDAAACLPARLLGDVRGRKVADLCAAPGGKTAQLIVAGAEVTAVDASAARLKILRSNLKRLRLGAAIVEADAADWRPDGLFDAVLLDAPCSATGTLRRHPDALRLKGPKDLAELVELQRHLLRNAARLLRPEGRLVYCSCSLQPEEGENLIAEALRDLPEFRLEPVLASEMAGLETAITPDGTLRTFPHFLQLSQPELSGMDGFFAARLVCTAAHDMR